MAGDTAHGASRIWYIQFEDAKGKTIVEKHSTGRILKMLAGGQINAKARAKASADGAYYPLAQFPEFTKAVEDTIARKTVAIRKEDMQSLYKKVDREQKTFHLKRKLKDVTRNIVGMSSLIVLLAILGLVGWGVITFGKRIPNLLLEKIGFTEKSAESDTTAETATDPATLTTQ
jgi:hypothetical protein